MSPSQNFLTAIRVLGKERVRLLGVLTAGHFVIHWFQQFYPVILPALKSGLNLTNVEVGALTSAQQVVVGLGQLPAGMAADSMVRHRGAILALSLVSMGGRLFSFGPAAFHLGSAGLGANRFRHGPLASHSCRVVVE